MITFPEASRLILSQARSFGTEKISLEEADGRILAEDIRADRNYPPFNRAMMDGYAFMLTDWENGIRNFNITETIFAGQASKSSLNPGSCYKIMTGAAVPEPANVIIRREDSTENSGRVLFEDTLIKAFQNIARKGEDAKTDDMVIPSPLRCEPAVISLLASVGKHRLLVKKFPEVAIITTGNEIVPPGEQVSEFQIRNGNQFLLRSLLKKWNISPAMCEHAADDIFRLTRALEKAIRNDVVIINGGVSAGDADYVPAVLENLGVKNLFHKTRIRPGKPMWCGKTKKGGLVFALPGNPLSCLTTFTVFIEPYLLRSFGFNAEPVYNMPLLQARSKKNTLTEFFPVSIDKATGGLKPLSFNSSGDITAALHAYGLGVHPPQTEQLDAGTIISVYPFQNFPVS